MVSQGGHAPISSDNISTNANLRSSDWFRCPGFPAAPCAFSVFARICPALRSARSLISQARRWGTGLVEHPTVGPSVRPRSPPQAQPCPSEDVHLPYQRKEVSRLRTGLFQPASSSSRLAVSAPACPPQLTMQPTKCDPAAVRLGRPSPWPVGGNGSTKRWYVRRSNALVTARTLWHDLSV
jgi:hypothetical protein